MNYSFKKSHSRFLSTVLVLTLLASLLAGCQRGEPESTTPSTDAIVPPGLVDVEETVPTSEPTQPTEPINENLAVAKEQLSIRSTPSTDSTVIGYLDKGTEVEILRRETVQTIEWALIREGWVATEYLESSTGAKPDDPDASNNTNATEPEATTGSDEPTTQTIKGIITANNGLNIRDSASTNGKKVGMYAKGDAVTILETKDGWGRTNKGWISMQYVNSTGTTNNTTNNNTTNNNTTTNNTTTDGTTYFVTASQLNIRSEASTNGSLQGSYAEGDKITILETKNGWGKTNKGWVSMQYVYKTGENGNDPCKGIVTATQLNVRSGPGTGYNQVASVSYGDRVNVLERINVNGTTWGCLKNGWISLDHVYVDGTTGTGAGTGTVTGNQVNIRSGPGTTYGSVGSLNEGDEVKVLAQIKIGDMTWGCISKGWVSMDYVDID